MLWMVAQNTNKHTWYIWVVDLSSSKKSKAYDPLIEICTDHVCLRQDKVVNIQVSLVARHKDCVLPLYFKQVAVVIDWKITPMPRVNWQTGHHFMHFFFLGVFPESWPLSKGLTWRRHQWSSVDKVRAVSTCRYGSINRVERCWIMMWRTEDRRKKLRK
jgi:hypothetical protein